MVQLAFFTMHIGFHFKHGELRMSILNNCYYQLLFNKIIEYKDSIVPKC